MSSPVSVSSAPVGSSARISRRSPTTARAIATRCCWPPDISSGNRSASSPMPTSLERRAGGLAGLRPLDAVELPRQRDVLGGGQRRDQVEVLEDVADRRTPHPGAARLARARRGRCPRRDTCPTSGLSSPPARVSRVDLPEPDGPITATSSPACAAKVTAAQRVHLGRALAVDAGDVCRAGARRSSAGSSPWVVPGGRALRACVGGLLDARRGGAGPRSGRASGSRPRPGRPASRAPGSRPGPRVLPVRGAAGALEPGVVLQRGHGGACAAAG